MTEAAARGYAEHGWLGLTTSGVGHRVGSSASRVEYHFPHTDDLVFGVIDDYLSDPLADLDRADQPGDARAKLQVVATAAR